MLWTTYHVSMLTSVVNQQANKVSKPRWLQFLNSWNSLKPSIHVTATAGILSQWEFSHNNVSFSYFQLVNS